MKLGEGGEAFFVFETSDDIPDSLQTSPVVSPTGSPRSQSESELSSSLQEPDYLDLDVSPDASESKPADIPLSRNLRASTDLSMIFFLRDFLFLFFTEMRYRRNHTPVTVIRYARTRHVPSRSARIGSGKA